MICQLFQVGCLHSKINMSSSCFLCLNGSVAG
uniref:Uncharacterized protein n=1 Tax=Anguilla anguilla TaxID=7936 RepID=A0A0E9U7W6_ANGAN